MLGWGNVKRENPSSLRFTFYSVVASFLRFLVFVRICGGLHGFILLIYMGLTYIYANLKWYFKFA